MHIGVLAQPDSFHTRKWTKALQDAGAKVTLFSMSPGKIEGVPCVQVRPRWTRGGELTYASFLGTGDRLRAAMQEHNVDIANPIDVTPYGVWTRRANLLIPVLAIAMGADILEYPPKGEPGQVPPERLWSRGKIGPATWLEQARYPLKQWLFRREVAKVLERAEFITGDNWVLVEAMRNWFGVPEERSALNRWGVEPELFDLTDAEIAATRERFGVKDGQRLLLSPRGVKPVYQGDVILDAFEVLLKNGSLGDARVIMLSAGYAVPSDLDQQARALEAAFPQFSLIRTAIPREEMCRLWTLADVFVSAPVYDGYSNALSEGRYIGAIPVVNDTPATREVMKDGEHGRVVVPFKAEPLAAAISEIWTDLPAWKATCAPVNRAWVVKEAMLSVNIRSFLNLAEDLLNN